METRLSAFITVPGRCPIHADPIPAGIPLECIQHLRILHSSGLEVTDPAALQARHGMITSKHRHSAQTVNSTTETFTLVQPALYHNLGRLQGCGSAYE